MPSQTIYITDEVYEYAVETAQNEQSVNQRLAELARKGKHHEQDDDTEPQCQHKACEDVGTERLELRNGGVYYLCEDHAHMNPDGTPAKGYEPNDPSKFHEVDA